MSAFLAHIDLMPVIYGLLMFIGLAYTWRKILKGEWLHAVIDVTVFLLVFQLHGHSMTGGFAAMVCAFMASMTFPRMMEKHREGFNQLNNLVQTILKQLKSIYRRFT